MKPHLNTPGARRRPPSRRPSSRPMPADLNIPSDGVRAMRVGLLGRKVGMTQVYQENGVVVPVTVLECGPCTVLQVRTEARDGYHAWQLGFQDKKRKKANQAERGHARKVSGEPKRFVREVRQDGPTEVTEGQT